MCDKTGIVNNRTNGLGKNDSLLPCQSISGTDSIPSFTRRMSDKEVVSYMSRTRSIPHANIEGLLTHNENGSSCQCNGCCID
jgi:hypothetical protein